MRVDRDEHHRLTCASQFARPLLHQFEPVGQRLHLLMLPIAPDCHRLSPTFDAFAR